MEVSDSRRRMPKAKYERKDMHRTRKAFTFVEIMVVVVLIGLLATLVVPRVFTGLGRAKHEIAKSKMAVVEDAIARFMIDCGRIPTQNEGLEALITPPDDVAEKWAGPYLRRSQLLDPWDREYIYVAEGQINIGSFDLISYGADGEPGGEGENADIYND